MAMMTPEEQFVHRIVEAAVQPLRDENAELRKEIEMLKSHNIEILAAVTETLKTFNDGLTRVELEVFKCQ